MYEFAKQKTTEVELNEMHDLTDEKKVETLDGRKTRQRGEWNRRNLEEKNFF